MIAMEYCGYSIYEWYKNPTQKLIVQDAENLVQFVNQIMGVSLSDIIIMGRSIGTGVACQISSRHKFCATVLISPFKSLPEVAKFMFPMIGNLAHRFVEDKFDSHSVIGKIQNPILFLHGSEDNIVPKQHSLELYEACKSDVRIFVFKDMTHNSIRVYSHICKPVLKFFKDQNIDYVKQNCTISFPGMLFVDPFAVEEASDQ